MSQFSWNMIETMNIRHYKLNDECLIPGDKICFPSSKFQYFSDHVLLEREVFCNNIGCNAILKSNSELEAHHKAKHMHHCATCNLTLPSNFLLDRHLLEVHDSYFKILSEKKQMYTCLLESCSQKFWNSSERKKHCIKKHSFPSDFRFHLDFKKPTTSNLDYKDSCPGIARSEQDINDNEMDDSSNKNTHFPDSVLKCKNKKVFNSFSFGIGVPVGFRRGTAKSKEWHQKGKSCSTRTNINRISFADFSQILEEMQT